MVCKVLVALLQPKLEHLVAEESMEWLIVASALEGMATVEMLLVAHETPESWWEKILPKLSGAKPQPDEGTGLARFRAATMVTMATNYNVRSGSNKSVSDTQLPGQVGDHEAPSSTRLPPIPGAISPPAVAAVEPGARETPTRLDFDKVGV